MILAGIPGAFGSFIFAFVVPMSHNTSLPFSSSKKKICRRLFILAWAVAVLDFLFIIFVAHFLS
jgi:hypothetical protein